MYVTRGKVASLVIAAALTGLHFATGHAGSMATGPLILVLSAGVVHIWFPEAVAALRRITGFFRLSFQEPTPESVTVIGWVLVGLGIFFFVLAVGGGV